MLFLARNICAGFPSVYICNASSSLSVIVAGMNDFSAEQENPCLPCGICCSNFRVSFYHGEIEGMPSGWVPGNLVEKLTESRACMKGTSQKNPRCIALEGTPGVRTACTIYERRPSPCREFVAWDEDGVPNGRCQKLRAAYGLPLLPLLRYG